MDDDVQACRDFLKPMLALYVGGMGARGQNFYNRLAQRYGFEAEAVEIQDHYLAGRKGEAAAAVPDALVDEIALVGDRDADRRPARGLARERRDDARPAGATAARRCRRSRSSWVEAEDARRGARRGPRHRRHEATQLAGGASKEAWAVTTADGRELLLRRAGGGVIHLDTLSLRARVRRSRRRARRRRARPRADRLPR